jgi:hypothetical protein
MQLELKCPGIVVTVVDDDDDDDDDDVVVVVSLLLLVWICKDVILDVELCGSCCCVKVVATRCRSWTCSCCFACCNIQMVLIVDAALHISISDGGSRGTSLYDEDDEDEDDEDAEYKTVGLTMVHIVLSRNPRGTTTTTTTTVATAATATVDDNVDIGGVIHILFVSLAFLVVWDFVLLSYL